MNRFTEKELAARYGLKPRTIQNWRATWDKDEPVKLGPPPMRIGKNSVFYREEDVLAYEAASVVGGRMAPVGWDATVKRAASMLDRLADQAKTEKAGAVLASMRDELRRLITP